MTSSCSGPLPPLPGPSTHPLPPQNVNVISGYVPGTLDLRWDNPAILAGNSLFTVVGVNIYRSDTTDLGPFYRINDFPAGGSFYRDQTMVKAIQGETINWATGWVFKGDAPADRRWVLRTEFAIVKKEQQAPYQRPTYANAPTDVRVFIDGIEVPVDSVFGPTGEITLINQATYNVATEAMEPALLPGPDSVVQINYHTMTNFVRTGLDTKLWYRLTTVVLDSTTPSGYFETNLGYCPPHSVIEVETLDYIWREAIRRNHWILQQGGERVSIFVRRQTGLPCMCKIEPQTREFSRQPSNRCHLCFVPGTLVRTETGYRAIEQIKAGEKVLSSDGLFHPVLKTFVSPYVGELVSVLSTVGARPILSTPEHPFKVLRGVHNKPGGCGPKCDLYIGRGDGNAYRADVRKVPSGRWWARAQMGGSRGVGRVALGTYVTREEAVQAVEQYKAAHHRLGHELKWEDASALRVKDWLVAKWPAEIRDIESIEIPHKYRKNTHLGLIRFGPTSFKVDEEFLWVVGLYLAEGSSGSRAIQFSLHKEEEVYQQRLLQFFSALGYNPVLRPNGINGINVSVSSTTLANWFSEWLGRGCANKHVPEELMLLPAGKIKAILQGVYDGDGWKGGHEITQTSEVLALQLAEILHRVGERPLIRR